MFSEEAKLDQRISELPPLSLYIHFPWCIKKCPYCDFNSHRANGPLPESAYIDKLITDLLLEAKGTQGTQIDQRTIKTIFMGGGTPSLISGVSIKRLLTSIRQIIDLSPTAEISLECNPGTLDRKHLQDYFSAGVNRISIGVQSFQDKHLKSLGRVHSAEQAIEMIKATFATGFENINIDLMHGLPQQGLDDAMMDLEMAVKLGAKHISWYQLTIEPNTYFYTHPPELPDDESLWSMQLAGQKYLQENGYQQYEVSAYALPEYECRHNLNYWLFGDYIGLGAGAHGKVTETSGVITRSMSKKMPNEYISSQAPARRSAVKQDEAIGEFLMNALRLKNGFDAKIFSARTGLSSDTLAPFLAKASARGLITSNGKIKATERGFNHLNELLLMAV